MELWYKAHEGLLQILVFAIGIIALYITIIQPIWSYTRNQKIANKDKRFETFHILIDHFTGRDGAAMLDRQLVIVFELRRFPEYYPVTKRILGAWILK